MYILTSVTELELEICESFYETKQEAITAMEEDIIRVTEYNTLEEIVGAANAGYAGFSDDDAWAETKQSGTGQWKIVQVPNQLPNVHASVKNVVDCSNVT